MADKEKPAAKKGDGKKKLTPEQKAARAKRRAEYHRGYMLGQALAQMHRMKGLVG